MARISFRSIRAAFYRRCRQEASGYMAYARTAPITHGIMLLVLLLTAPPPAAERTAMDALKCLPHSFELPCSLANIGEDLK